MRIFGIEINPQQQKVEEIKLDKDYKFMYENFIISSQRNLYLLLEENNGIVDALCFKFIIYKYGYPNDEVQHPLSQFGLGFYGFYEVKNSDWIQNLENWNSKHPKHIAGMRMKDKHYVARFKDLTLEIIATGDYEFKQILKDDLLAIVNNELQNLNNGS